MQLGKMVIGATLILTSGLVTIAYAKPYCDKPKTYGAMPAHPYYGHPGLYHRPYHGKPHHNQSPHAYQKPAHPQYGYQKPAHPQYGYKKPVHPHFGYQAPAYQHREQAAPAANEQKQSKASEDTKTVSIRGMQFGTGTITIKAGESVTWMNEERMPHTVTANDGSFSSSALNAGNTFTQAFDKPGEYSYYCQYHPNMKGVVIVTES